MKRLVRLALVVVFAGYAGPALAFTTADFKGWYAFGFEGLESGLRIVSTGVMRLDGVGAVTGRASLRKDEGGPIQGRIANSTYSVNADGTGLFLLGFFPDEPNIPSMVIHLNTAASSVNEFEFSSAFGTFSGRATRRGPGPFTRADLTGTYAFRLSGLDGFTPTVASGVMTFDGIGMVTGRATFKKEGGGSCVGDIRSSTYGVNPDGTGFLALGFFADVCFSEAVPLSIAVFRSGRGFELASSSGGLYSGTATLQVPAP
jgi:hypothetical protein